MDDPAPLPEPIASGLARLGIDPASIVTATPLTGGVSSDIWRIATPDAQWCVKRALPVLKTAAHWEAPVERSAAEADWLAVAGRIVPGFVPELAGFDAETGTIVLELLEPSSFETWKSALLARTVDVGVATAVGANLRRLHDGMATVSLRAQFDHPDLIHALRLEPYLERAAARHPDCSAALDALVAAFHADASTVVHGDVSPKNVLVGADRIVLLDAECATWGDPMFDVGFCLTHLCAKAVHLPDRATELHAAAQAWIDAYGAPDGDASERSARWLAAILLARVDGASPLEYLSEAELARVRDAARRMLLDPAPGASAAIDRWFAMLNGHDERDDHV